MAGLPQASINLAICIRNDGYEVSLERRKLYEVVEDAVASRERLLRVVDESGDDYLFPAEFFVRVQLPKPIEQAVIEAA